MEPNPKRKKKKTSALSKKKKAPAKGHLLGLGLDSKDEHVRITKGPNFSLVGGSHETHEKMQETAVKFNEQLDKRGKPMEQLSMNEFLDIMDKIQR